VTTKLAFSTEEQADQESDDYAGAEVEVVV
jgi:hypothetical protein